MAQAIGFAKKDCQKVDFPVGPKVMIINQYRLCWLGNFRFFFGEATPKVADFRSFGEKLAEF